MPGTLTRLERGVGEGVALKYDGTYHVVVCHQEHLEMESSKRT